MTNKKILVLFLFIMILVVSGTTCNAGWIIYYKPAYKGRVLDMDTKEPIKGALVFVTYHKCDIIGFPKDCEPIEAKETLTDENGEFSFPIYFTLTGPNSYEWRTQFTIYKPGYGGEEYVYNQYSPPEEFFEEINFGKATNSIDFLGVFGVVELPKANTWQERLEATRVYDPIIGSGSVTISTKPVNYHHSDLPLRDKMIDEERKWLDKNRGWKNYEGKTALISAAREGLEGMVKTLLASGVDVNYSRYRGMTALMAAAEKGHAEIVRMLLEAGADPGIISSRGYTAIQYAARNRHYKIVNILENALGGKRQ